MSLYGLGGKDDKYAQASDLLTKASGLFKGKDHAKAGDLFIKAWTLLKPQGPDTLWNAGVAYEQAAADQKETLAFRRTNAYSAKAAFTEWQGLKIPGSGGKKVGQRIAALKTFIAKLDKAMEQGKKKDDLPATKKKDDLPATKKKASFPMALVIIGLVGVIGFVALGKKKGKKGA